MFNTMIKGSFSTKIIRCGKVIKSLPRTDNLITRGGMESLGSLSGRLFVGTGSSTPLFSNTALDSPLTSAAGAGWNDIASTLSGTNYIKESRNIITFPIGAVVGNISELSLSNSGQDSDTRALFKDGAGDPTTITVTAQDQLVVTYFVQKTISMIPFTSSILADLDGVPTAIDYTIRPCISSNGDSGEDANFPGSIYRGDLYFRANSTNFASIAGPDYIPVQLDAGGSGPDASGSHVVVLTASGNEVTHTVTMPTNKGNLQWKALLFSPFATGDSSAMLFQLEFDGPNYITKTNTDQVVFKIKETMNQVIV